MDISIDNQDNILVNPNEQEIYSKSGSFGVCLKVNDSFVGHAAPVSMLTWDDFLRVHLVGSGINSDAGFELNVQNIRKISVEREIVTIELKEA